jgi:carbamoyltransferase
MVILGLGFTDHEASAALVVDGKLIVGIARERLTRIKKDGRRWGSQRLDLSLPIQYCLGNCNITLRDVDLIAWNHIAHIPSDELFGLLASENSIDISKVQSISIPHHFAHACCSFYLSPFREAAVLVADGSGGHFDGLRNNCSSTPESQSLAIGRTIVQNLSPDLGERAREHESFYYCSGDNWESLRKVIGRWDGIGAQYATASRSLFGDKLHAGKTMGLAPYGTSHSSALFLTSVAGEDEITFTSVKTLERTDLEARIRTTTAETNSPDCLDPSRAMFAATVQSEAEEALLAYARWLRLRTKSDNLCLSGGVALNCVANSRIARESQFTNIFVPPMPGDDGIAVGCALYAAARNGELKREGCPVFLGRSYNREQLETNELGLEPLPSHGDRHEMIAEVLANGEVVAWYQGASEMGPRALGHRSFLADPRRADMRDYLNRVVKNREWFRPFAPVVLEYAALEYFEESFPSYFMSFVSKVRMDKRSVVPAITHVDGTARYQVLRENDNAELYQLIKAFSNRTGIPLLLNTSFNSGGEPIVETPLEAARCMLSCSINYLVVDGNIYRRADQNKCTL